MSTPVPPRGGKGNKGNKGPRKPTGRQMAQQAANRRRRIWVAAIAVVVVVVVIAVLVLVGVNKKQAAAAPRTLLTTSQLQTLTSVPLDNLVDASSRVTNLEPVTKLTDPTLVKDGKPEILFIGAEFCPICATERWAMMVALSQFGTFSNVSQTRSAVEDGDIPTLSFYGSTYTSPYLAFVPVETTTNQREGSYYKLLQTPTKAQQALWESVDAAVGLEESFPFVYMDGKYVLTTAQYSDTTLEGSSFDQIFNDVGNNSSTIGADIDSSAASLVKYICGITGDKPANVCSAVAGVNAAVTTASSSGSSSPAG